MTKSDSARTILCVCTGNAARSVMAATMLRHRRSDLIVASGGTLVLEGHPMSMRTRTALARFGLRDSTHRSHQVNRADVAGADVIIVMESDHLQWLARKHPEALDRAVLLPYLAENLPGGATPLRERVSSLDLVAQNADPRYEVIDPAGGEQPEFDVCAAEIDLYIAAVARLL